MSDSTLILDANTLEVIIRSLIEKGISYTGSDWIDKQSQDLSWDFEKGQLVAKNFYLGRLNGKSFHVEMVSQHDYVNGYDYRAPLCFEHDEGRAHVGDVHLELRLHPSGRWMARVNLEEAFLTSVQLTVVKRVGRSAKANDTQAIKRRPDLDLSVGRCNNRRVAGKSVANHLSMLHWSENLSETDFMDVYDVIRLPEDFGCTVLIKALAETPDAYAKDMIEIFLQTRNRSRKAKTQKTKK